ncbi:MAG TPA: sucrose phosphorylase [Gammaproteobacteria bacterium]|nr:sucrose phosphorylase [Gammaproteobacteria bacterium]
MKNAVQLITYVDRLSGGGFADLTALLEGPLRGLFAGVHVLPFFDPIDAADAGFDPCDHTRVDPRLGDWSDVAALAAGTDVMADLIVNHISRDSPQFRDFLTQGSASPFAELFLTRERVFPHGATDAELQAIYRPRPGLPFTAMTVGDGSRRHLWTTFTPSQIDIDVTHARGREYVDAILAKLAASGVRVVRLDAVGYAVKKRGTSCFMIPETYELIADLSRRVRALGMETVVEIHSHYRQQIEIAGQVDWVYDFALPPLVLHAFAFGTARPLASWLRMRPHNALNVLDTHDGIGIVDIGAERGAVSKPGLVQPGELDALVESIHTASAGMSRLATGGAASNLDLYQVNCTFYDALARVDRDYLLARAIQFFTPGIPQVYYVGLLAGHNDLELLRHSGVGRDINRHYYGRAEVTAALQRPVVRNLCALIRLRNAHPAFRGEFSSDVSADTELHMRWRNGVERAELRIDFRSRHCELALSEAGAMRSLEITELADATPERSPLKAATSA